MKNKNKNFELSFQKETFSKLNVDEMNGIKGGFTTISSFVCAMAIGYVATKAVDYVIDHFSDACTAEGTTGGMS